MKLDTSIFKAYDIRGIFPDTINNELAYKIGYSYAEVLKPEGEILVGADVRIHSKELKENLIRGLIDAGLDVVDVGLISTDMLYFGVGNYKTSGGIQVTASHNPPEWHGFKMVKKGPIPMTLESGIGDIRDYISSNKIINPREKGHLRKMEIWDDYCKSILKWIEGIRIKPI